METGVPYVPPSNELEADMVKIWQELLGKERIGIKNGFFELGGDSIIVLQVVSRARRTGQTLQPRDLFMHQTIAKLSAAIAERAQSGITGEQGYLQGASGLLPIQQWYLEQEGGDKSHFNQSILVGIDKSVTEPALRQAVEQLIAQHDALRFKYEQVNGQWRQEYGFQMPYSFSRSASFSRTAANASVGRSGLPPSAASTRAIR